MFFCNLYHFSKNAARVCTTGNTLLKHLPSRWLRAGTLAVAIALTCTWSHAGPLRDRLQALRAERQSGELEAGDSAAVAALPPGARVLRDVAYGPDALQRMDVYLPRQAASAPVVFMVHGGGWRRGDKAAQTVVQNKMARWVGKGFVFVSVNYRMLPQADLLVQAQDVASALRAAQAQAADWGGDPARFVLMGHSAGAHLVALLNAAPGPALAAGARPWLGVVLLDSAVLDVVETMQAPHMRLYDAPFGSDPAYWRKLSPSEALAANAAPVLAVCSSRRSDSCPQARQFASKAQALGLRATVLAQDLTHKDINQQLGLPGAYTDAVEAFMAGLDGVVQRALGPR